MREVRGVREGEMPVIAVAQCSKLSDYEESARRAGGDVRVLDRATAAAADAMRGVDGLLLTGGGDVLPSIYGATAHPAFDAAEPGRDEYEIRARAPRDRSGHSALGHLPRHSGAERRARRHAHPAHPRRSGDDGQPPGADAAALDRA